MFPRTLINPVEHEKRNRIQILIIYMDITFCGEKKKRSHTHTHKFSDTQVFLQRITKGVIKFYLMQLPEVMIRK